MDLFSLDWFLPGGVVEEMCVSYMYAQKREPIDAFDEKSKEETYASTV